jgi:predicted nucleic acid-binding protein
LTYWDASALVPLLVMEKGTALARGWLREDPEIATWAWTKVELVSAVERAVREKSLAARERRAMLAKIEGLFRAIHEVTDDLSIRERAVPLLGRHSIRAADAGQIGAALLVAEGMPATLGFACLDSRLSEAAEREGFPVLSWPDSTAGS